MNGKSRCELMKRVQQLAFMKTETELFLDTHPDCRQALDYYHRILGELEAARMEYVAAHGPITADESSTERWNWVESPWPWHTDTVKVEERRKG